MEEDLSTTAASAVPSAGVQQPEEESEPQCQSPSQLRDSQVQSDVAQDSLQTQAERDEQPPLKKVRKEKKSKGKTLLSAELYRSMTSMLGLILKGKQEQAQDAEDTEGDGKGGGGYGGCRWGDLVTAYLAQVWPSSRCPFLHSSVEAVSE